LFSEIITHPLWCSCVGCFPICYKFVILNWLYKNNKIIMLCHMISENYSTELYVIILKNLPLFNALCYLCWHHIPMFCKYPFRLLKVHSLIVVKMCEFLFFFSLRKLHLLVCQVWNLVERCVYIKWNRMATVISNPFWKINMLSIQQHILFTQPISNIVGTNLLVDWLTLIQILSVMVFLLFFWTMLHIFFLNFRMLSCALILTVFLF